MLLRLHRATGTDTHTVCFCDVRTKTRLLKDMLVGLKHHIKLLIIRPTHPDKVDYRELLVPVQTKLV